MWLRTRSPERLSPQKRESSSQHPERRRRGGEQRPAQRTPAGSHPFPAGREGAAAAATAPPSADDFYSRRAESEGPTRPDNSGK